MGFKETAGDIFGIAKSVAGQTGKYAKVKAEIASNKHKQNELFEEIGKFVMGNADLRAALDNADSSYGAEYEDLLEERQELADTLAQLKEEGLIPDDEDDEDIIEIVAEVSDPKSADE